MISLYDYLIFYIILIKDEKILSNSFTPCHFSEYASSYIVIDFNPICVLVSFTAAQEKKVLSPEEKAKLKEERLQNKRLLESCLTLVRSLYSREEVTQQIL